MVMSFGETQLLETLKQKYRIEFLRLQEKDREIEHLQKMSRLEKMLEIAKAGGKTESV